LEECDSVGGLYWQQQQQQQQQQTHKTTMPKTQVWRDNHDKDWWSFGAMFLLLLLLAVTIAIKRYWLVPYLERRYKKNAVQRQKLRIRRLRDTLADPVLVRDLERRLMIQYRGNALHVQDTLDRMRQQVSNYYSSLLSSSSSYESATRNMGGSHETIEEDDDDHHHHHHEEEENENDSPRGEEKKEAVTQILYGTFAMAITLYFLQSFYMVSVWQEQDHIKVVLQTIFVVVVHVVDSLLLYRRQHIKCFQTRTRA
jgi:hypothetical protein